MTLRGRLQLRDTVTLGGERPGFLFAGRISVQPFGAFDDDVEGVS